MNQINTEIAVDKGQLEQKMQMNFRAKFYLVATMKLFTFQKHLRSFFTAQDHYKVELRTLLTDISKSSVVPECRNFMCDDDQ